MKKKLLFVIDSLSGGGAEKVLSILLKRLDNSLFSVTLCPLCDVGLYKKIIPSYVSYCPILPDANGLSGIALFAYKLKYHLIHRWLPARWIYRFFIPKGSDIEIAFTEGFPTKILSGSTARSSKRIAWVHIDLDVYPWTLTQRVFSNLREETACFSKFDRIVAVSNSVKSSFVRRYGQQPPVTVLYNPIDYQEIRDKAKSANPVPWPKDRRIMRFISVGRLTKQKGFDRLIRICGKLIREGYSFFLVILGEGDLRNTLENMILEEELEQYILLPGFLPNPYPVMAEADLFLCTSRAEGYSTAITESLILGTPVITTDCSGMRELIANRNGGIITENKDDVFYETLKELLDGRIPYEFLKENALARGADFQSVDSMPSIEQFLLSSLQ